MNHKKIRGLYREESLTAIEELRARTGSGMREARNLDEIGDIVVTKISEIEANKIQERLQTIGERPS